MLDHRRFGVTEMVEKGGVVSVGQELRLLS